MPLSSAYASLPIRKKPRSRSRTAQESTRSRPSPSSARHRSVCARRGPRAAGEIEHALELLAVTPAAPGVVVEVLPPAGRVGAGCLEVPERVGADPDVAPRGRDRQRADPFELGPIADQAPIVPAVLEATAAAAAGDSRLRAIATAEARHCFRRIPRLPAWPNSLSQSLGGHFEVGDMPGGAGRPGEVGTSGAAVSAMLLVALPGAKPWQSTAPPRFAPLPQWARRDP